MQLIVAAAQSWCLRFGNSNHAFVGRFVAMIVATAAPVGSHEWYTGLRSPSGADCCNERDCRPVAYRVNHDTGREEIQANGAWYPVEYDKVLPFSSPDGNYHACGAMRWENPTSVASCFPAWPLCPCRPEQPAPLSERRARPRKLSYTLPIDLNPAPLASGGT
jgi:hypothetical protein